MIYILLINNEVMPDAYTSLKPLFERYKLSYNNSSRHKRLMYKDGIKYEIKQVSVNKIRGRGVNSFNK